MRVLRLFKQGMRVRKGAQDCTIKWRDFALKVKRKAPQVVLALEIRSDGPGLAKLHLNRLDCAAVVQPHAHAQMHPHRVLDDGDCLQRVPAAQTPTKNMRAHILSI